MSLSDWYEGLSSGLKRKFNENDGLSDDDYSDISSESCSDTSSDTCSDSGLSDDSSSDEYDIARSVNQKFDNMSIPEPPTLAEYMGMGEIDSSGNYTNLNGMGEGESMFSDPYSTPSDYMGMGAFGYNNKNQTGMGENVNVEPEILSFNDNMSTFDDSMSTIGQGGNCNPEPPTLDEYFSQTLGDEYLSMGRGGSEIVTGSPVCTYDSTTGLLSF